MKNLRMRLLNYLLYLVLCGLTGTGLLLAYRLPPGSRGGRGLHLLGWDRHEWGDIHLYLGLAFLALILLHLIWNWVWLRKIAASSRAWPLLAGLAVGFVVIAFFLLAPIGAGSEGGQGGGHERRGRGPAQAPDSSQLSQPKPQTPSQP